MTFLQEQDTCGYSSGNYSMYVNDSSSRNVSEVTRYQFAAQFAAPFGMQRLLSYAFMLLSRLITAIITCFRSYLETGVSPFGMKPWVWIIVLGLGPLLSAFLYTQFTYAGVSHVLSFHSQYLYNSFTV